MGFPGYLTPDPFAGTLIKKPDEALVLTRLLFLVFVSCFRFLFSFLVFVSFFFLFSSCFSSSVALFLTRFLCSLPDQNA